MLATTDTSSVDGSGTRITAGGSSGVSIPDDVSSVDGSGTGITATGTLQANERLS